MNMKSLSREEKAERAEAQKASARQAMTDYNDERARVDENSARLKALRLAREAEQTAETKPAAGRGTKGATRRARKT